MKKIELEIPEGKCAKWIGGVLRLVDNTSLGITERIKTFKDACLWCEDNYKEHLVTQWTAICDYLTCEDDAEQLLAYLKLRIIVAALNEGWEPIEGDENEGWGVKMNSDGKIVPYCEGISTMPCDHLTGCNLRYKTEELARHAATTFGKVYSVFLNYKKEE